MRVSQMSDQPVMEREWDSGLASLAIHSLATVMSDMDAAIEWYERVLGFRLAARAEVRANGAKTPPDYLRDAHYPGAEQLEFAHPSRLEEPQIRLDPLFADPPRHVLPIGNKFLVFEVDDIAQASAELAHNVGHVRVAREGDRGGFVATAIRDFDGNLINILGRH